MAPRGRKPKPTHLKLVTGLPGKRKVKRDDVQPRDLDLPMPPPFLSDEAKVRWGQKVEAVHRLGLLTELDDSAFAAYCQAYGRWQQAEQALKEMSMQDAQTRALMMHTKNGNAVQNPLVGTANKAMELMNKCGADFGMSPVSRVNLSTDEKAKPADPTAKFFD